MTPLIIEPSDFSPKVVLDPGKNIFELTGSSRIENTSKFYQPVLQWLEQYQHALSSANEKFIQGAEPTFEFKLDYFNSTSAKCIMDALMKLDKIAEKGYNIKAKWHYKKNDEDMKESGEGFAKLLKKLPIEFVGI